MKHHLKHITSAYYQGKQLRPEKLQQLLTQTELFSLDDAEKVEPGHSVSTIMQNNWMWFSAASFVLIFAGWLVNLTTPEITSLYTSRLVKEIALNHNKALAPEFQANSIVQLNGKMSKLDFILANTQVVSDKGLRITGARYCSIQGNIAAQIKLDDPGGNRYTLYQTATTAELEKIATGSELNGDIRITVWREKGIFYGLAESVTN